MTPKDWEIHKLGDFIDIKHGYAFKGDFISSFDNGIVLVTPGNFAIGGGFQELKCKYYNGEYPEEYILKPNDLIVTMTDLSKEGDTLGYCAKIPNNKNKIYLHNQRIGLIEFKSDKIIKDFLYWYMRTKRYQKTVVNSCSGSVIKHTSPSRICNIEIPIPPIETQKKIAKVLSSLDDKIELNNKINQNLEQQAQAIFKSWFVDFEPFGGKMPEDWKTGKLGEVANVTMGQSPNGKSYNENGYGEVFYQGRAEFGYRYPTRRLYTTEPKRMASAGDILMSVRAPVGDINVALEKCCIGRGLASISSKDNFNSFILYTLINLKKSFDIYNAEGTVFGAINKDSLNSIEVIIPTKERIYKFEKIAYNLDKMIRLNTIEIQNLQKLRDTLLPKLMSGEIDVDNLEM